MCRNPPTSRGGLYFLGNPRWTGHLDSSWSCCKLCAGDHQDGWKLLMVTGRCHGSTSIQDPVQGFRESMSPIIRAVGWWCFPGEGGLAALTKAATWLSLYSGSSFMAVLFSFSRFLGHKVDQGLGGLQKQDNHPGQSLTTDCTMYIKVANWLSLSEAPVN